MRKLQYLALATVLTGALACTPYEPAEYTVDKPESLVTQEALDAYDDLKTYVDRDASPAFAWGSYTTLSDLVDHTPRYRMIHTNFDQFTTATDMTHGAIVTNNGTTNFFGVQDLLAVAAETETPVFGHALVWHQNQNATWLNSVIAPSVIASENNLIDVSVLQDGSFKGWERKIVTAALEAVPGTGYASNEGIDVTVNGNTAPWNGSLLGPAIPADPDKQYFVVFSVKANQATWLRVAFDKTRNNYPAEGWIQIPVPEVWQRIVVQVPERIPDATDFVFFIDFGYDAGRKIAVDATSFTVKEGLADPNDNSNFIEMDDAQKSEAIDQALQGWIASMMEVTASQVSSWDVVNQPMDDADPTKVATGVGKTLPDTEFYWQDYLGEGYAARAAELARAAYASNGGTAPLTLFVNETGLLDNPAKVAGLIDWLDRIEATSIDGIGTEIKAVLGVNTVESIRELFATLAASGKLVRVSKLEVDYRATEGELSEAERQARLQEVADYYQAVIEAYFAAVPAGQRAGITLTDPIDNGASAGLWISAAPYTRLPAYAGVADALAGN